MPCANHDTWLDAADGVRAAKCLVNIIPILARIPDLKVAERNVCDFYHRADAETASMLWNLPDEPDVSLHAHLYLPERGTQAPRRIS